MNASLHLFDLDRHSLPEPTTFEDLEALRERLARKADGKNLRFIEFALRFEARFPMPTTELRGPLVQAGSLRRAAWHFDLPAMDTMLAYQAAVEIAGSLGLVAYDARLGVGFLPGGRIIPESFASTNASAKAPDDTLRGETEVRAVLAPALAAAMVPHGFTLAPQETGVNSGTIKLARTLGAISQQLTVQLMRYEYVHFVFEAQHLDCAAIFEKVMAPNPYADHFTHAAFALNLKFFSPGPDGLHRWSLERRSLLGDILAMVRDKLLPLAELCRTLGGIDQLLNDDSAEAIRTQSHATYGWSDRPKGSDGSQSPRDASLTRIQRLVVAHLNGNPATPHIAAWFDAYHAQPYKEKERAVGLKLLAVLASTAPLVHWPDAQAYRASMQAIPATLQPSPVDARERRCHHWEVTTELEQAATKNQADFWERFAGPTGTSALLQIWQDKALTLPPSERIAPAGLECRMATVVRDAGLGNIEVLLLLFPPICGLDEKSVLALARAGQICRMHIMGHEHTLDEGRMRSVIHYHTHNAVTHAPMDRQLSIEEFLDHLRSTFD